MRKDWHKLFEDFFDDEQREIEVSEPEIIVDKNNNIKDYDHLFILSCDFAKYESISKQSLVFKKVMRYMEYVLDKTDFIDSYSRVVIYSKDKNQIDKFPDIMEYRDGEYVSTDNSFNFGFCFNCIKVRNMA